MPWLPVWFAAASAALLPSRLSHVRMCAPELHFDGTDRHDVQSLLSRLPDSSKIPGVYCITDSAGETQFVGTSRNVALSLRAHVAKMPERVASVQLLTFTSPDRKAMEAAKREWIRGLGRTPDGNGAGAQSWAEAVRSTAFSPVSPTLQPSRFAGAAMNETPVSSPFETAAAAPAAAPSASPAAVSGGAMLDFTAANVDRVLEEVRPYLISDGGNVAVVSLDESTRNVYLRLEGACGSCPSSTVTMKMGIERVLREKFSNLGQVLAVEPDDDDEVGDTGAGELTIERANASLEQIMPAILGLGGKIEVVSAVAGTVTLRYEGPDKIKFGVELALRDNPLIQNVEFI
jgi:Fe-S cluster biogenesis protein NfuA